MANASFVDWEAHPFRDVDHHCPAVSLWILLSLNESPGFSAEKSRGQLFEAPLTEVRDVEQPDDRPSSRWSLTITAASAVVCPRGSFYALFFLF